MYAYIIKAVGKTICSKVFHGYFRKIFIQNPVEAPGTETFTRVLSYPKFKFAGGKGTDSTTE